jgi:hypothetical protein
MPGYINKVFDQMCVLMKGEKNVILTGVNPICVAKRTAVSIFAITKLTTPHTESFVVVAF